MSQFPFNILYILSFFYLFNVLLNYFSLATPSVLESGWNIMFYIYINMMNPFKHTHKMIYKLRFIYMLFLGIFSYAY